MTLVSIVCALAVGSSTRAAQIGAIENPALADEASAVWVNPAGLAFRRGSTGYFSRSFGGDSTYTNILFAGPNGGFGWQREDGDGVWQLDRWRFAFAGGDRRFAVGAAAQYANPSGAYPAGNHWAWDLGATTRPVRQVSAGVVMRNLGAPGSEPRSISAGLALRPVGDYLTLLGGAVWDDGDPVGDPANWHVGGVANIGPGVELSTTVNQDGDVFAGLSFVFGNGSIGGSGVRPDAGKRMGWAVARTSGDYRRTALHLRNGVAEIRLAGEVRDRPVYSLFGGAALPLSGLLAQITRAADAPDVEALYLRIEGIDIGQGMAGELRAALLDFKETTGKPVICYLVNADVREYYIATVADSVFLEPMGHLLIGGYAAAPMFFRRMFDKLGLEAQFARVGEYKAATEVWTDSTLSAQYRSQLEDLLDDWYADFLDAVAGGRHITPDSAETLVDRGLFGAADALTHGLVDGVRYEDEAFESAEHAVDAAEARRVDLAHRRTYDERWGSRPHVAVIFASGEMMTGDGGSDIVTGGSFMGATTICEAIKAAREDDAIRAVVLRVDSPGGYALAGDMIWREANLLAESDKPFVVSVGDVAASGGYYIAVPADTIVCNPGAIVGSIGIFGGKVHAEALFDKIGLDVETVQRGENAAIYSMHQPFTPEQLELLQHDIDQGYRRFLGRVSAGRDMTEADVDSVGRGRVFTGERGIDAGLVDVSGGLDDAIQIALEMAGIQDEAQIVVYPQRGGFLERFIERRVPTVGSVYRTDGSWLYDPMINAVR